jgi:SAM-dependent methyltransferase
MSYRPPELDHRGRVEPPGRWSFVTATLPARPDLEHLRREAKNLLRRLQAADVEDLARRDAHAPGLPVALSTAQLIIAREHGFGSWAHLKTVVSTLSASSLRYDTIGRGYSAYRRADPRIAAAVHAALGDARTVVNVGAGTGSYEPTDRPVIPVEPSTEMAQQRDPSLPPAVLGVAESLPLTDASVDAAMAILTVHHWADQARGLAELRRVARRRIVVMTIDVDVEADMWLFRDYAPDLVERDRRDFPAFTDIQTALQAPARIVPVPVPADCLDGFLLAFWSRPEAVLDPGARAATSGFARMDNEREQAAVRRLARDLESGAWDRKHGHLREEKELDVGLRLLISDCTTKLNR